MFEFNGYLKENKILIIAEFANAFEGKKDIALKMVDEALAADVDALKFQVFFADELLSPEHPKYTLFRSLQTSRNHWYDILNYASKTNKLVFLDVYGEQSLAFSKNFNVDAYKIPSSEISNYPLIEKMASIGKPLMISSGGATVEDIEKAVDICTKNGAHDYVIMHGFQSYPTKIEDTNLCFLDTLKQKFGCPLGYSDHVDGDSHLAVILPLLAAARGAKVIEKHFTLNREAEGTDYESAVSPAVLGNLVKSLREIETILGNSERILSSEELAYRKDVRKRVVAASRLEVGRVLSGQDVVFKRSSDGFYAEEADKIIGKTLHGAAKKNEALTVDHFK